MLGIAFDCVDMKVTMLTYMENFGWSLTDFKGTIKYTKYSTWVGLHIQ